MAGSVRRLQSAPDRNNSSVRVIWAVDLVS
jgi:hypothetical protein